MGGFCVIDIDVKLVTSSEMCKTVWGGDRGLTGRHGAWWVGVWIQLKTLSPLGLSWYMHEKKTLTHQSSCGLCGLFSAKKG